MMNLTEKEKSNALNEIRILASIHNPNIISYKEAFIDEASMSVCIIMEFADNGDLYQKMVNYQKTNAQFSETEIWSIFIQVVRGLHSLHEFKILHRDMKSANVFLFKDGKAKLGDLNVSKIAKAGLGYTQTGTPYYASPEVWKDMPYDTKSDIWSLGCVLYEMATLRPPFKAEDMSSLYRKVLKGLYPKISSQYSQDLNIMIKSLLQVAPINRPSCDTIMKMPIFVKRAEQIFSKEDAHFDNKDELLKTIRIPKNLLYLTDRLPRPNYSTRNEEDHILPSINQRKQSNSEIKQAKSKVIHANSSHPSIDSEKLVISDLLKINSKKKSKIQKYVGSLLEEARKKKAKNTSDLTVNKIPTQDNSQLNLLMYLNYLEIN